MRIDNQSLQNRTVAGGTATSLNCYYDQWTRTYPCYPSTTYHFCSCKSEDKGKKAFEIAKTLKDKKLAALDKVEDFIDLMNELIRIL